MTTVTIKEAIEQLSPQAQREVFVYLRKKINPVQIYVVDSAFFPDEVEKSISRAEQFPADDLVDFKG